MAFKLFKHKDTGVIASYPEHYATHPVIGNTIEIYEGDAELPCVDCGDEPVVEPEYNWGRGITDEATEGVAEEIEED